MFRVTLPVMLTATRYLIIAGYSTVLIWSIWVIISNHLNPTRRLVARFTAIAALVWVVFYATIAQQWITGDAAVLWSRMAHVPTIAILLLVIQTVQQLRR